MRYLYLAVLLAFIVFGQETEANGTFEETLDEILSDVMSGVDVVVSSVSSVIKYIPTFTNKVDDWCSRMTKRMGKIYKLIEAEWSVLDGINFENKKDMIKKFDAIPCNKLCRVCNILQRAKVRSACTSYCKTTCRWEF